MRRPTSRRGARLGALLLTTLLFVLPLAAADEAQLDGNDDLVVALIEDLRKVVGLPGFAVAIAGADDAVWDRGFGYADVESELPVTADTRFCAASVSKILTATALMLLVQDGRLDLDRPVSEILAEFPQVDGVTPRLLAGHLSGIAHYQQVDKIRRWVPYESVDEALTTFRASPRAGAPGERYVYSTHGFTLLSAVIEKAAGAPFLDVLRQEVFAPVGMPLSGPDSRTAAPEDIATLYNVVSRKAFPIRKPEDVSYKWAGSGLVSTPRELVLLARAYQNGLLRPEIVDEMWTSQQTNEGELTGVGIAWRIGEDFAGRRIVHHAGSMGGARSVLMFYPDQGLAIATMTNGTWQSWIELNAALLLEAFVHGGGAHPSAERTYSYTGDFANEEATGSLEISGRRGSISMPIPFAKWVSLAAVERLPIHHLQDDLWALVTPYGLAVLTIEESDGGVIGSVELPGERRWRFIAR